MKKFILFIILIFQFSMAEENYLYDIGNTVGYIKDNKGNKYLVIETKNGAKLIKTKENPEDLVKDKFGLTKKEFSGDEK
ncbi:hypothetical protein [Hydrogenothermus marinus]|uniref:Uncharacterized protein n=1 Tax=Hydrogenothermus marinus TaxID=133270 RepID=A0A3M0BFB4_9AQUI|nr:hypothetical protein [Hydrogenothermus marinus]RMA96103.1 hypothetical protein CLV39_1115 [Hydrogenothermus marinus]